MQKGTYNCHHNVTFLRTAFMVVSKQIFYSWPIRRSMKTTTYFPVDTSFCISGWRPLVALAAIFFLMRVAHVENLCVRKKKTRNTLQNFWQEFFFLCMYYTWQCRIRFNIKIDVRVRYAGVFWYTSYFFIQSNKTAKKSFMYVI